MKEISFYIKFMLSEFFGGFMLRKLLIKFRFFLLLFCLLFLFFLEVVFCFEFIVFFFLKMRNSFFFDCYYKIGVVVFFVRLCCVNGGVREINSNNFYNG